MAQVTNGLVEYARTRKDDDYGINRSAKAQLSFTVVEGENAEATANSVMSQAVSVVYRALDMKAPAAAAPAPAQPQATAEIGGKGDKAALAQAAGAPTPKPPRAPRAQKPAAAPAATDDPSAMPDDTAKPAAAPAPAADEGAMDDDLLGGAPAEVTDVELTSAVTHRASATKNSIAIRQLIGKYGCVAPKTVRDLPQELRHKFLEDLAKVPVLNT